MSTASIQSSSSSARSACAGIAPASAEDQAVIDASSRSQSTEFDDLLPANGNGEKPSSNLFPPSNPRSGNTGKRLVGPMGDSPAPVMSIPGVTPDLMAMIALSALPAPVPDATPITLPEFDGSFSPVATSVAGEAPMFSEDSFFAPPAAAPSILPFDAAEPFAPSVVNPRSLGAPTPAINKPMVDAPAFAASAPFAVENLPAEIQRQITAVQTTAEPDVIMRAAEESLETAPVAEPVRGFTPSRLDRGVKAAPVSRVGANLAAPATAEVSAIKTEIKPALKNFLPAEEELDAGRSEFIGTDVAKRSLTMASAHFSPSHSALAEVPTLAATVAGPAQSETTSSASLIAETQSVAHGAVEAALSAADRVSADRNSVTVQFSVGGNDLAVRVDFRGGAVQTTFRTDSPELRAALAHEWAAAGSQITDAAVRMAPPVFTSSDAGTSTSFSGERAYQNQQHQQQRESSSRPSAEGFSLNAFRPLNDPSAASRSPAAAVRQAVSTAQHLHTFA